MNQFTQQMSVSLPVALIKEGGHVVAYTPALDLSTSGKDEAEAKVHFNEIVKIFFDDLIEQGTLNEVLTDMGWKRMNSVWNPPIISQQSVQVSLPVA